VITDLVILGGGVAAGLFGSLLGLGGGTLIVPLLTLGFGLPLREAVGVSLVCVIVTSSASAGIYLQRQVANLRLGMTLELFTATGALGGALVAFLLDERLIAGLFAILLAYVAASMLWRGREDAAAAALAAQEAAAAAGNEPAAANGPAAGNEPAAGVQTSPPSAFILALSGPGYTIRNLPIGVGGSVFAGIVSALLGIGGGTVKVPVMHIAMGVPLRVATATSNLMIGITASAGAIVYLLRDEIDPYLAGLVCIGVFAGAIAGARLQQRIGLQFLRMLFVVVLLYVGFQMARKALAI
jgi:uncharacterized membrane protein YfcA